LERLGAPAALTDEPERLAAADRVIFPGVGEAGTAMQYLKARRLDRVLKNLRQPFLGICLGLQLMCTHSEEGDTPCLGIFPETVRRIPATVRVPHMGWNDFDQVSGPLFAGISAFDPMYFVHSYCAGTGPDTVAWTHYHAPFSAALQKRNYAAVQFHPEKSAWKGRRLLENFLRWEPPPAPGRRGPLASGAGLGA
jgi:glutamine amidotransferase